MMQMARASLESGEGDVAQVGGVMSRLSDSIGRAMLVEQKLAADGGDMSRARAEWDRILRTVILTHDD